MNIGVGKCNDPIIQNILNILGVCVPIHDGCNTSSSGVIYPERASGYQEKLGLQICIVSLILYLSLKQR